MDEISAAKEIETITKFEVVTPLSGKFFDEKGNAIKAFRKEVVNPDQLMREIVNLQAEIDKRTAQLDSINNVKE